MKVMFIVHPQKGLLLILNIDLIEQSSNPFNLTHHPLTTTLSPAAFSFSFFSFFSNAIAEVERTSPWSHLPSSPPPFYQRSKRGFQVHHDQEQVNWVRGFMKRTDRGDPTLEIFNGVNKKNRPPLIPKWA